MEAVKQDKIIRQEGSKGGKEEGRMNSGAQLGEVLAAPWRATGDWGFQRQRLQKLESLEQVLRRCIWAACVNGWVAEHRRPPGPSA